MLQSTGFDLWADDYDKSVGLSDEDGSYPFAGYRELLNRIYNRVLADCGNAVLDIGFGTGALTAKLYERGRDIYGQDFSGRMIELARARMPNARLYQEDFSQGLADALTRRRYDAIIATYSLHHLTDERKAALVESLLPLLNAGGWLFIGDVAFETRLELEACQARAGADWDAEEIYFVAEEWRNRFPQMRFERVSHCAGIFTYRRESMRIRAMEISDYEAVYALWRSCRGMGLNNLDDSRAGIQRFLERNPTTCLVAEEDGAILGAIMAGHDGRRGYIYHTAVSPDHQRRGIGARLVRHALDALSQAGIHKAVLVVFARNESGSAFWEAQGFHTREDLVYRDKALCELERLDT